MLWYRPAASAVILIFLLSRTLTGLCRSVTVPSPSWPLELKPQATSGPAAGARPSAGPARPATAAPAVARGKHQPGRPGRRPGRRSILPAAIAGRAGRRARMPCRSSRVSPSARQTALPCLRAGRRSCHGPTVTIAPGTALEWRL